MIVQDVYKGDEKLKQKKKEKDKEKQKETKKEETIKVSFWGPFTMGFVAEARHFQSKSVT